MRTRLKVGAAIALVVALAVTAAASGAASRRSSGRQPGRQGCDLGHGGHSRIKHLIYLQFDNTHLLRDRSNFASDLELMPHLKNFLSDNGTLSDNEHTILISHTAGGILSSLTGLYPDRMGQGVTNVKVASVSGFTVGMHVTIDTGANAESKVIQNVGTPGAGGTGITLTTALANAHANGVPFYGPTATDPTGDMTKVFGEGSPEWQEGRESQIAPFATAARAKALTDFVGITIHCGADGGICDDSADAKPDQLPDEPGGYSGFEGLFGAKYVNPAINDGSVSVDDTNGDPITDPFGQPGFPGFDGMPANVTLGYVAQMQEAGVPVTFGYISDAHDNHQHAFPAPPDPNGVFPRASGPGESDYVQTLHEYDQAFATFFARLQHDGITKQNTLFVLTADENDHFAGGSSSDGTWSHTFCNVDAGQQCPANQIGEVNANLLSLIPSGAPSFSVHNDSAPTVYVNGDPARTDATLRKLERDVAAAKAIDPYQSSSATPVALYLADKVGEKTLHMVTADPQRTPSFTLFGNPDYFLTAGRTGGGAPTKFNCPDSAHQAFVCIDYHFAWSHGDATEDIGRTWLGLAGPGVKHLGLTSQVWSDHTDIQPTILSLLDLKDSYQTDGRVLKEFLENRGNPNGTDLTELGSIYKQINAPFGQLSFDVLGASTRALGSGSTNDDS